MKKSKIIWRENLQYPEMQTYFINEAENNGQHYIEKYKKMPESLNGRYIDSDLMKETFDLYSASTDSRRKYIFALHNSAAVLTDELFEQMLSTRLFKKCIFVAGAPGAGKTFLIQSLALAGLIDEETIIFEGNITTPHFFDKLEYATKCGAEPSIIVVNAPLELTAENIVKRFEETGRNVGTLAIAKILSEIPKTILEVQRRYPKLDLAIYNKKTNFDIDCLFGFENLDALNHGSCEEIFARLAQVREKIEKQLVAKSSSDVERE